jgi:hypothetical protein
MKPADRIERPRWKVRMGKLTLYVPANLKAELEAEAWEEHKGLEEYVLGLLKRRGKWARTVGLAGGYDLHQGIVEKKP